MPPLPSHELKYARGQPSRQANQYCTRRLFETRDGEQRLAHSRLGRYLPLYMFAPVDRLQGSVLAPVGF
jgi:hypothetical protein